MSLYIGPYVEVTVDITEKTIDNCKDHKNCPTPGFKVKFCSQCGIDYEKRFEKRIEESPKVHYYDLFGDNLASTNSCSAPLIEEEHVNGETFKVRKYCYVPNAKREGRPQRMMNLDVKDNYKEDWTDVDIHAEMQWFKTAYADEIKKLEEAYGEVKIKWGMHRWY